MTLHAAKGLEFEAVFLAGVEDGTLPYERPWANEGAEREEDQDEERRLCYVGMTRAKKRLTLSLARRRMGYGEAGPSWRDMPPSRFLQDLPPELFGELVAREVRAREARAARGPVIRRQPGALPGEPHVELDGEEGNAPPPLRASTGPELTVAGPLRPAQEKGEREPTVDYSYDQRAQAAGGSLSPGARVLHQQFGEGVVLACDGAGADRKATVQFDFGAKRVLVRYLALV